jgi:hypothetical protein
VQRYWATVLTEPNCRRFLEHYQKILAGIAAFPHSLLLRVLPLPLPLRLRFLFIRLYCCSPTAATYFWAGARGVGCWGCKARCHF